MKSRATFYRVSMTLILVSAWTHDLLVFDHTISVQLDC